MNILLIGAPGSGKGTQAQKLATEKNFTHLSTGDLFRKNIREGTPLGKKAKSYIDQGLLVPDGITNDMVRVFLQSVPKDQGLIFDGFPRNPAQAEALDQILREAKRSLAQVIYFEIQDDEVVKRLTGRLWAGQSGRIYHIKNNPPKRPGFCDVSGEALVARPDDKEEVIRSRLKVFHENIKLLLSYYENKGSMKSVPAELSPEELFDRILKILEKAEKS